MVIAPLSCYWPCTCLIICRNTTLKKINTDKNMFYLAPQILTRMKKKSLLICILIVAFSTVFSQPFSRVIVDTATIINAHKSNYAFATGDYNGDRVADLYAIMIDSTASGKTELHVLSGDHQFQKFILQTAIPVDLKPGEYEFALADYNADRVPDLYIIHKKNTASTMTDIHILSGAGRYQKFLLQTATTLQLKPDEYTFGVAEADRDGIPDLVCVQKAGTGSQKTEIHILGGTRRYFDLIVQKSTAIPVKPEDYSFIVADYDWDAMTDVIAVQKANTASGSTELHILNGAYYYQRFKLQTATPLPVDDGNSIYLAGDFDGDDASDFFAVKYKNTASGKIEVKVLCGRCKKPKKGKE